MKRNGLWLLGLVSVIGCNGGASPMRAASERAIEPAAPLPAEAADGIDVDQPTPSIYAGILQTGDRGPLRPDYAALQDGAPESCGNLTDDDGDGAIDCQDSDCAASCVAGEGATGAACAMASDCAAAPGGFPFCLDEAGFGFPGGYCSQLCDLGTPGSCGGDGHCLDVGLGATGVCFDGCVSDGDCARGACVDAHDIDPWQPSSTMLCYPYETACTGGSDEDGDGLIDCEDPDCWGASACLAATCAAGLEYSTELPPDGVTGTSYDSYALAGSCVGADGFERIYTFVAPVTQSYTLSLTSATDQGVYVLDGCAEGGAELACANLVGAEATETLVFWATEGQTYYIVVDADSPAENGDFQLELSSGS